MVLQVEGAHAPIAHTTAHCRKLLIYRRQCVLHGVWQTVRQTRWQTYRQTRRPTNPRTCCRTICGWLS